MRPRLLRRNLLAVLALLLVSFLVASLLVSTRVFSSSDGGGGGGGGGGGAVEEQPFSFGSVSELSRSVFSANYRQRVLNVERFPAEPELVLVVQVHDRPQYLQLLIQSLERTRDVQRFLLIFSHDYFSEEIHLLVQRISFCKVLQIYFPFSAQLYPSSFPGQDPRDCPRDASKEEAVKAGCLNAAYPDSYGHYREAAVTQTKHHWWWKLHFVWERVGVLQGYGGFVVFLEEDNYVFPDFLHFYKSMLAFREDRCPDCDLLALGNHRGPTDSSVSANRVSTAGWASTKHNLGVGVSREVYYRLMGCSSHYCTYDDYNWDWTLQHLSGTCIPRPLKVLQAEGTRVLHTGDCGLHQRGRCRPELAKQRAEEELQKAKAGLFPSSLVLDSAETPEHKAHVKNGGWGDVRDHALCQNYAKRL